MSPRGKSSGLLNQDLAASDQREEARQERGDDAVTLRGHDDDWDKLAFARNELAIDDIDSYHHRLRRLLVRRLLARPGVPGRASRSFYVG